MAFARRPVHRKRARRLALAAGLTVMACSGPTGSRPASDADADATSAAPVRLVFLGDVMLGRGVGVVAAGDPASIFERLRPALDRRRSGAGQPRVTADDPPAHRTRVTRSRPTRRSHRCSRRPGSTSSTWPTTTPPTPDRRPCSTPSRQPRRRGRAHRRGRCEGPQCGGAADHRRRWRAGRHRWPTTSPVATAATGDSPGVNPWDPAAAAASR